MLVLAVSVQVGVVDTNAEHVILHFPGCPLSGPSSHTSQEKVFIRDEAEYVSMIPSPHRWSL